MIALGALLVAMNKNQLHTDLNTCNFNQTNSLAVKHSMPSADKLNCFPSSFAIILQLSCLYLISLQYRFKPYAGRISFQHVPKGSCKN